MKKSPMVNLSLEEALRELEKITEKLEANEENLEESFQLFEKGLALHEEIKKKIMNYEKKIKILSSQVNDDEPKFDDWDNQNE